MKAIMKRTRRGCWVGLFPLGQAEPAAIEHEIRAHVARIAELFTRSEVERVADHLRVHVEILVHIPGRGHGTDSAIIGNLEHYTCETIRLAQPPSPAPQKSVYEWLRGPAL